jgi:hypothetical protein
MERNTLYALFGAAAIVLVLGVTSYLNMTAQDSAILANCNDGTLNMQCSEHKPNMCINGELVENASTCGCPVGSEEISGACKKIDKCNDGTLVNGCSSSKPLYCENGNLVQNAGLCGCPEGYLINENVCVLKNNAATLTRVFSYTVNGTKGRIEIPVYSDLKVYLANISRKFACDGACPTYSQMEMMILNESREKNELGNLVSVIEEKTSDKDGQARIAISLVQAIPYDTYAAVNNDIKGRYPYEVVYDNKGVCGEKSRLLAYILKDLGYGVALFSFEPENHMAVGIKCPTEYSYRGTGYCFVETTTPSIITDSSGTYGIKGGEKLTSMPNVIVVSDGRSFNSVSAEYSDALDYVSIFKLAESNGSNVVDNLTYMKYRGILDRYGIQTTR